MTSQDQRSLKDEVWRAHIAFVERALREGVRRNTNVSIVQEPFSVESPLRWTAHFGDAGLPGSVFYKTKDAPEEARRLALGAA